MGNIIGNVSIGSEDALESVGQNGLEQVYLNMPEVRFYFAGDREQDAENLQAYIGSEELKFQSFQRFSDSSEGICYYCLLDVSASISETEFSGITEALSEFSKSLRPQDHMVFITFGEEVKTLFDLDGSELSDGQAAEQILALTNPDQKTLLFEAIQRMAQLTDGVSAEEGIRQVAFVITDGEDIAKGRATKEEALQTLKQNSIPVYGFTVNQAKKDSINAFGEFSRSTGGQLTILEDGHELSGFQSVCNGILDSYEAVFCAKNNLVSNEMVSVSLEFVSEKEKQQTNVMQDRWIKDTVPPTVTEVICQSPSQIQVLFSESVTGANSADNFKLQNDTGSFMPAYASLGSDGISTVLTFSDELLTGTYELSCINIKDCSMEQNLLEGTVSVQVEGILPEEEKEPGVFQKYGLAAVLLLLLFLIAALFFTWRKIKKQNALVVVEGKAVLKSNLEARQHVSVEHKKLEEQELFFHVAGQKEEIRILLQKSMIVGRSSSCELIFDDPALSRQHFALELKDRKLMIRNLSQSGFTTVNGIRLGNESYILHSGDEIGAGQLKLTIRW